ncbi:MAG: para-nitrobenzyl esterase [Acidimicrobiaceae bacterium]
MIANTANGKIQGIDKAGVLQFRGIRFATAARFAPPQPVEGWDGVLDATAFGPIAPQNPSPLETMLGAGEMATGEDCLNLNICTPSLDGSRPVMVWIHGGGFTAGAGSTPWYAGNRLAAQGDVVIVTINYRLGAFGFLHLEGFPGAGNNGIRDQVVALEWVRDNIAAFGGDPGNVTIFGESAGGMSVGTLLGTPSAAGLFHRAIPQSGAANNIATPSDAERVTEQLLRELGLRPSDTEQLLTLDVAAILAAQQTVGTELLTGGNMLLPFCPVVDDVVLPGQPLDAVKAGAAADITTIIGTTADEWNLFHVMRRAEGGMNDDQLARRVARVLPADRAPEAIDVYRTALPKADNDQIFCAIGTDMVFRIPAVRLAEAQSAHQAATRMYLLSYASSAFDGALGACHAIDIPFVFDNVDRNGVQMLLGGVDDETRALSTATSRAWTAFARTGSPDHDGLPAWPTYSTSDRKVMELGRTRQVLDDPGAPERQFWDSL